MIIIKAIASKVILDATRSSLSKEYMTCVQDILHTELVQNLAIFDQHGNVSRLQHSINVSYYSFLLCKLLHLRHRDAARAGLLHDLFFYYWQDESRPSKENHVRMHPRIALQNARTLCDLTEREEEMISLHMFPLCKGIPRYTETHILALVDKYCAFLEAFTFLRVNTAWRRLFRLLRAHS